MKKYFEAPEITKLSLVMENITLDLDTNIEQASGNLNDYEIPED